VIGSCFRHGIESQTFVRGLEHSKGALDPKEDAMAKAVTAPVSPPIAIPVREILPWMIFAGLLLMLIYFVGVEEGATSIIPGMYVHEFTHDGRHLLGFPCH
jgi:hypothetical protein